MIFFVISLETPEDREAEFLDDVHGLKFEDFRNWKNLSDVVLNLV